MFSQERPQTAEAQEGGFDIGGMGEGPSPAREMEELPSGRDVIEISGEEEIQLEELVEEIINEKWREVEAEMADLDRMYGAVMDRMDDLEDRVNDSLESQERADRDIQETLNETTARMEKLEGKVNSLERAFKEFLPDLTENVRKMSRAVESMAEMREEVEKAVERAEEAAEKAGQQGESDEE